MAALRAANRAFSIKFNQLFSIEAKRTMEKAHGSQIQDR
jgi:hypothetical protein